MSLQEEQAEQRRYLQMRQRQQMALRAQQMAALQQQQQAANQIGSQMGTTMNQMGSKQVHQIGSPFDDIPVQAPEDNGILYQRNVSPAAASFFSACKAGDMLTIQSIITSQARTPVFLHHGLINALESGNVEIARYLLQSGAPISRQTPEIVLKAPADQQIALFEVLAEHGWTVNTPGFYGEVLLTRLIKYNNETLIDWFLAQGADPNLGSQQDYRDRLGGPDTSSCQALELAATYGSADLVQKLLNAGAKITNGAPLYYAVGALPPGANPHAGRVTPTREFDVSRIPVMQLLVENGAGVNDKLETRHMVALYPIVNAVWAGAVERVKWLLDQGADPDQKGPYGSAKDYAGRLSSDEMKQALGIM
ncbi:hypothetical protein FVEN_g4488 [Fusarium venenatum]|uniref:Uncharacterized protein n=1 Tax=Fusarium venenatum TaxID=56646 RepID=A0A2L2T5L9_9HYPO|nr:uncharacterized protein FVRRES_02616 [Fusarium venenatum]KAG8357743.1 hypothetical protein FVEN_g4488 [Fusarium venenatum]KAH7004290.1 ankyrin repeat-containing domain protein [Fusarium venenatum]CEI66104.1 unnamed protein product [Fusarium venenatum]